VDAQGDDEVDASTGRLKNGIQRLCLVDGAGEAVEDHPVADVAAS
jgi:hypothetical protein